MIGIDNWSGQKYKIVLIDPPWKFNQRLESRGKTKYGWGAEAEYERRGGLGCMDSEKIVETIQLLNGCLDAQCLVFLWTTPSNMREVKPVWQVLTDLKFVQATRAYTWIKLNPKIENVFEAMHSVECNWDSIDEILNKITYFGVGAYTASNSEDCWVFRRGTGWLAKREAFLRQIIYAPVNKEVHSRKPQAVRDRIVSGWGNIPRLELFATERDTGWDALGSEITNRDIREDLISLMVELEGN